MSEKNFYDVTKWGSGNPHQDIGAVINSIIADIKNRQAEVDKDEGGKPGAVDEVVYGTFNGQAQRVFRAATVTGICSQAAGLLRGWQITVPSCITPHFGGLSAIRQLMLRQGCRS